MTDYLEELLELTQEERDEDENAAKWEMGALPASPVPDGGPEEAQQPELPARADEESAPAEFNLPERAAEAPVPPEDRGEIPGADGGEISAGAGETPSEVFWPDGLTAPVTGPDGTVLLRRPGAGDVELTAPKPQDSPAEAEAVTASLQSAERGLETLYRQASQAGRSALQALTASRAGQPARLGEPEPPRQLTVSELDWAVRRDSRRYDGGMTLF